MHAHTYIHRKELQIGKGLIFDILCFSVADCKRLCPNKSNLFLIRLITSVRPYWASFKYIPVSITFFKAKAVSQMLSGSEICN